MNIGEKYAKEILRRFCLATSEKCDSALIKISDYRINITIVYIFSE